MIKRLLGGVFVLCSMAVAQPALAQNKAPTKPPSLWLEELTWIEARDAIRDGYTNVIIPSGGIEQNGIHLPLNKHHLVVQANAERMAEFLGQTLIAPVVDLIPEGSVNEKSGHMAYAGTISIPRKVYADVLDYTARSLYRHGFTQVFFIGDSGTSQLAQEMVAKTLQRTGKDAYYIASYYADEAQVRALAHMGYSRSSVGGHAGLYDTAEVMAVAPEAIREYRLETIPESAYTVRGAWGDNKLATAELGKKMQDIKLRGAIQQICRTVKQAPKGCSKL